MEGVFRIQGKAPVDGLLSTVCQRGDNGPGCSEFSRLLRDPLSQKREHALSNLFQARNAMHVGPPTLGRRPGATWKDSECSRRKRP